MKLGIVIPVLKERDDIEGVIQRSLAARQYIQEHSSVTDVEVTVVSDGSTDHTVELAPYSDLIRLIVFSENQGYDAAIKEAWMESDAELLGSLNTDGTCDPKFFAPLCNQLLEENTDVAVGRQSNGETETPPVSFDSSQPCDTGGGMRVVRRSSLARLLSVHDELNFIATSDSLHISELAIPSRGSEGASKIHGIEKGFRYLRAVLETGFLYRAAVPLNVAGSIFSLISAVLVVLSLVYYLQQGAVLGWMIDRFLVSDLLGTAAALCFSASYIVSQMIEIALSEEIGKRKKSWAVQFFGSPVFWAMNCALAVIGVALPLTTLPQMSDAASTYERWLKLIAMSFCWSIVTILLVTRCLEFALGLVRQRVQYWQQLKTAGKF